MGNTFVCECKECRTLIEYTAAEGVAWRLYGPNGKGNVMLLEGCPLIPWVGQFEEKAERTYFVTAKVLANAKKDRSEKQEPSNKFSLVCECGTSCCVHYNDLSKEEHNVYAVGKKGNAETCVVLEGCLVLSYLGEPIQRVGRVSLYTRADVQSAAVRREDVESIFSKFT